MKKLLLNKNDNAQFSSSLCLSVDNVLAIWIPYS